VVECVGRKDAFHYDCVKPVQALTGALYDREKQKGNANRATLATELVVELLAVDRGQRNFLTIVHERSCPPKT